MNKDFGTAAKPAPPAALRRRLGIWLLVFYGVGVMVGAGIYVLVGKVAVDAGPLTPVAFLIAGAAAALSALSFAELSARIPESAGEAAYVRKAFGLDWFSVLIGFSVALVGVVSAAAILKGGVGYILAFVDAPRVWLEIGVGILLGMIAAIGIVESLVLAAIFTVLEIIGLLLVVGAGFLAEPVLTFGEMADLTPLATGAFPVVFGASVLAFFAFIGFEDMVNLAEEVVDPVRVMPRAILIAVTITTLLYCLVAVAALHAVEAEVLAASEQPLALVFEVGSGRSPQIILGIAIFATLNGVLAQLVMSSRVLYGLGRHSPAFHWAYRTHPRLGTPLRATAAATALVIAMAYAAPIGVLAEITSYILLCIFIVVNVALLVLKRKGPPPPGAPNIPILAPISAILISIALLFA